MKSILLYIVYHDDESEVKAKQTAQRIMHAEPSVEPYTIRVSNESPYFESQVFAKMNLEFHDSFKWIGVVTHNFDSKNAHNPINIEKQVGHGEANGADVISLLNIDFEKPRVGRSVSFVESAAMQHGPFLWMVIHYLFKMQGYKEEDFTNKDIQGFFSNWWLAKPAVMAKYVKFVKQCQHIVSVNPLVSRYIKEDGYYLGHAHKKSINDERLQKIFGCTHYTLHPFVFERLPPIFCHVIGCKLYRAGSVVNWHLGD